MIEVTEGNIGNFTINDVIMPIIGHKVKLPKNEHLRQIYEKIMKEDDMSMAKFESHSQMVATSATGSYRKIIAKAEDITFDVVRT